MLKYGLGVSVTLLEIVVRLMAYDQITWSCTFSVVILLLCFIPLYVLYFGKWTSMRLHVHTVRFERVVPVDLTDQRADSLANVDMKHPDALDTYAIYEKSWYGFVYSSNRMRVSLELLSQLTTAKNLEVGGDDDTINKRIAFSASKCGAVNNSCWQAVDGQYVVQNTCFVAFALYKQLQWQSHVLPFPSQQSC
jgi:hypothetical protein